MYIACEKDSDEEENMLGEGCVRPVVRRLVVILK